MIPFFKNSAFRIWSSALLAFLISIGLLARGGETAGLAAPLMIFGIIFCAAFVGIGWLTDHIVRLQLDPLLQEAGILERGGMGLEAERVFEKALALLDSFLVSPRRRRRYLRILGKRMARFYAAQAEKNDRAFKWITRYLNAQPKDGAIAEVWLRDMEGRTGWTKFQQDLAARIGEARLDDRLTQTTLARIYIRAGRTDFAALQTYRRLMARADQRIAPLIADLARLFIQEGRADEWALRAYVQAARQSDPSPDLRCALAACLRWMQATDRNRELIARARQVLGPVGTDELERMSSGFLPPSGRFERAAATAGSGAILRAGFEGLARGIGRAGHGLQKAFRQVATGLRSPRIRTVLKLSLISILALAAVALLLNTAGHLVQPPPPPADPVPDTTVTIKSQPYTLQVAAYLKPEHAERFIKILKAKGQDAYRVEAQAQKKTWYQVRVGHFPTKAAARTHGQQLKSDGIIEDYYVANFQGP